MFVKYYSSIDIVHTSEALDFIHHLTHTSLFDKEYTTYFGDAERKFLYLIHKVNDKLLVKCSRVISFLSFISKDSITLLNYALGSKKAIAIEKQ